MQPRSKRLMLEKKMLIQFSVGGAQAAAEAAQKLLSLTPYHVGALKVASAALLESGGAKAALPLLERAVALAPRDVELQINLAAANGSLGKISLALMQLERLLEQYPSSADAYRLRADLLACEGRQMEALRAAERAVALDPLDCHAFNRLGEILLTLGRNAEALQAVTKAIDLYPGEYFREAALNLGAVLNARRQYSEAAQVYMQIEQYDPDNLRVHAPLLTAHQHCACWGEAEAREKKILAMADNREMFGEALIPPFYLLGAASFGREYLLHAARVFAEEYLESPLNSEPLTKNGQVCTVGGRLNIGYISSDFHDHATSHLVVGVFECHDRERIKVHAYSYGPDDGSALRQRVMASSDVFRDVRTLSDGEIARQITKDRIDVLIDLKGWTADARLGIQALRPAPIIVSWLGYPGTLGNPRLADYLIGDSWVTPPEHAGDYAEILALMPNSYQPNDAFRIFPPAMSRPAAGVPEQKLIFCSFNQTFKINRDVFGLWCEILRRTPDSVLWLLDPGVVGRGNLRAAAVAFGIDADRLIFAPRLPNAEHLARLQCADLALDTFPYGSHTTGADALWVGVPMLTVTGETFASRVGASLLNAVGMQELIASTVADYVEIAVELGNDRSRLRRYQDYLNDSRHRFSLFDTSRFAGDLEQLLFAIVKDYMNRGSTEEGKRGKFVTVEKERE